MKQSNLAIVILRDGLGRFLYWPIWWYSEGFIKTASHLRGHLFLFNRRIGFTLNWQYIFKPMYGDYSFAGRGISLVFRFIMSIFLTIIMAIYFVVIVALLVFWLILPFIVVFGFIHQLGLQFFL
jgi:hypothetical protein